MILKLIVCCFFINIAYSIPNLIIVSYDAFRYDFLTEKNLPHLNRLRRYGSYADYLINVFPTKTFPNHHSIATGLYPEAHGVLGNSYYDMTKKQPVHISYEMFHYDDSIAPIWRRNEDESSDRHSGVMMWPGGCYSYQGKNITYCTDYDHSLDWYKRVDTIIQWMKDPKKPANLIMLYFEEPDTDGHIYGINSNVVDALIKKLDDIAFYLEKQLEIHNLLRETHVVHLSDHGMIDVKPPNFINVTQYLDPDTYNYAGSSPVLQFYPHKGFENEVYERLKNGSEENGHFKVYRKEEYPERWHYKNNRRTPPVLVIADVGYALDDLIISANKYAEKYNIKITNNSTFGVHGYDYTEKTMHPFFMARGPKIRPDFKVPPFNTVDLYNFFCNILDMHPSENNGNSENILDMLLRKYTGPFTIYTILSMTAGGITIALILISCAALLTLLMIKRQQSITTNAALNKRFPQTFHSSVEAQHLLESEEA